MKHLTIVYTLPDDFDAALLTNHQHASAFAWSHKMDECRKLIMENEQLKEERNRSGVELRNAVAKATKAESQRQREKIGAHIGSTTMSVYGTQAECKAARDALERLLDDEGTE